jgi:hypothetical protein
MKANTSGMALHSLQDDPDHGQISGMGVAAISSAHPPSPHAAAAVTARTQHTDKMATTGEHPSFLPMLCHPASTLNNCIHGVCSLRELRCSSGACSNNDCM